MHPAVRQWVAAEMPQRQGLRVLEYGSRNVNGTINDLMPAGTVRVGVDQMDGPNVDVVADAATYRAPAPVDVVVCCEVFEHAAGWRDMVASAARNLVPGGTFIATMACDPRGPHSAFVAGPMGDDEWYENVDPDELADTLAAHFVEWRTDVSGADLRCVAVKG